MAGIWTASWSTRLPAGATAVGISRSTPRNRAGYRRVRELEPGPWFRSVPAEIYLQRYGEILARLDPAAIRDRLFAIGPMPVLLCYEHPADIQAGKVYCHRHLVAEWLEHQCGIQVPELDHPELDRFAHLRPLGIEAPSYCTLQPSRA